MCQCEENTQMNILGLTHLWKDRRVPIPDPYFYFVFLFALILRTHTNTPHILHTYTPYPTGPSLMPTPFSGDYQPPPTTTGAQPPYLPEGEHSVA